MKVSILYQQIIEFIRAVSEINSSSKFSIPFYTLLIILISFSPSLAFDIYLPNKKEFKETSKNGSSSVTEIKTWEEKKRVVVLTLIDVFGGAGDNIDIPVNTLNPQTAYQMIFPEVLENISENWGEQQELEPDADFDTIYYRTFDSKNLKLGGKTKCVSFVGYDTVERDIICGFYCKADKLSNDEILSALRSITIDESEATKPDPN